METETKSLEPQKGETADKFKERIEETQRELKRAQKVAPKAPDLTAQVPAVAPKADVPLAQEVEKKPLITGNAELDEWLEKKGPMTLENLASSYREAEREMHRKAQEVRGTNGQPPAPPITAPPIQGYPPYYPPVADPNWGRPPAYAPPQPPPPVSVEALAKQYGLSPEDFEKVAPLANDMARSVVEAELNRRLPPLMNQVNNVNREVGRQKELVDLMSDPAFKNPQVQFEMDRIFKEEPNTFVAQPQPIRYAYEKALTRIARANLGGSNGTTISSVPGVVPPNSKPPATAGGNGNGGGGAPSGSPLEVTAEMFAGMSMAEKTAHLQAIGVRPRQ